MYTTAPETSAILLTIGMLIADAEKELDRATDTTGITWYRSRLVTLTQVRQLIEEEVGLPEKHHVHALGLSCVACEEAAYDAQDKSDGVPEHWNAVTAYRREVAEKKDPATK